MDEIFLTWGFAIVFVIATDAYLVYRLRNYKTVVSAILLSLLIPLMIVRHGCFVDSVSVACVWGKSYLPLYYLIALFVGVPLLYPTMTGVLLLSKKLFPFLRQ